MEADFVGASADRRIGIIRDVLDKHGSLGKPVGSLDDDASLYNAGLTSHASVGVMLALEDAFDIEFPEHLLRRATFESIVNIRDALDELVAADA